MRDSTVDLPATAYSVPASRIIDANPGQIGVLRKRKYRSRAT
jgi:hypothetical protein